MTTPDEYKPRAGSKVAQAIELLQEGPLTQIALAELLEVDAKTMTARMESAVAHGVVSKGYANGVLTYNLKDASTVDRSAFADIATQITAMPASSQQREALPASEPPLLPSTASTRFGVFSDGSLVIEHDGQTINLDQTLVGSLRSYLSRMDA